FSSGPNLKTNMAETNSVTSTTTDPRSLELNKEDLVIKSLYKLSENLITFLNKPEGYDVKLEIGKAPDVEEFYAHSAILRARSTYFHNALSKEMINKTTEGDGSGSTVSYIYTALSKTFFMSTEDNVVIFKKENITPKAFKFLLTIIYGGFTKIDGLTSLEYLDLLEAYGELGIQGFDEYLQQSFLENHGEWIRDNLLLLERFSSKHEAFRDIRNFCYDQLCQNSDIVFKPSDVTTINKDKI
ncbi:6285_t:CDS:2, partial [Acaulospora morrowiae]